MIQIEGLAAGDIGSDLLMDFCHEQAIQQKYVKRGGFWKVEEANELREWSREKRVWVAGRLLQMVQEGGCAVGAFDAGRLLGFGSLGGGFRGQTANYISLDMLFVDDRWKRKGIGKALFQEICRRAAGRGGDKLFISAIPSVETVSFYFCMGCVDAKEIIPEYVDTEWDRYLEFSLGRPGICP